MNEPRGAAFPRRYPMVVVDVHDGDTAKVFLDRGGNDWWLINARLFGMAARELDDPGGPEARDALAAVLAPVTPTTIRDMLTAKWQGECEALKWDKWSDRIDARLWLPGMAVDVSTAMIQTGWAVAWDGRGAQPKPPWPRVVS